MSPFEAERRLTASCSWEEREVIIMTERQRIIKIIEAFENELRQASNTIPTDCQWDEFFKLIGGVAALKAIRSVINL